MAAVVRLPELELRLVRERAAWPPGAAHPDARREAIGRRVGRMAGDIARAVRRPLERPTTSTTWPSSPRRRNWRSYRRLGGMGTRRRVPGPGARQPQDRWYARAAAPLVDRAGHRATGTESSAPPGRRRAYHPRPEGWSPGGLPPPGEHPCRSPSPTQPRGRRLAHGPADHAGVPPFPPVSRADRPRRRRRGPGGVVHPTVGSPAQPPRRDQLPGGRWIPGQTPPMRLLARPTRRSPCTRRSSTPSPSSTTSTRPSAAATSSRSSPGSPRYCRWHRPVRGRPHLLPATRRAPPARHLPLGTVGTPPTDRPLHFFELDDEPLGGDRARCSSTCSATDRLTPPRGSSVRPVSWSSRHSHGDVPPLGGH